MEEHKIFDVKVTNLESKLEKLTQTVEKETAKLSDFFAQNLNNVKEQLNKHDETLNMHANKISKMEHTIYEPTSGLKETVINNNKRINRIERIVWTGLGFIIAMQTVQVLITLGVLTLNLQ